MAEAAAMNGLKALLHKLIDVVTLRAFFPREQEVEVAEQEADALANLYWNRAELKRQLSTLKEEKSKVEETLERQKLETEQVREMMLALERRIGKPEHAFATVVYFQLRSLWDACHEQLKKFSEDLVQQQEERERKQIILEFNQQKEQRVQEVDLQIVRAKQIVEKEKQALNDLIEKKRSLGGILGFFKRKTLNPAIEDHTKRYSTARDAMEKMFDARMKVESEAWPEYGGLGLKGKRIINIAIIGYAQYLLLHFYEFSIAKMARTVKTKSVHDVNFGERAECEELMKLIQTALRALHENKDLAQELKTRAKLLRSKVGYRNETDTIPMANSVSRIPLTKPLRGVSNDVVEVNVLADDYWDLLSLLLR